MGRPEAYDFIVVGAGSAGCVLASRLSADPSVRVALIEAGPSDRRFPVNLKTSLPVGNIFLLPHKKYNWQYTFMGGPAVNGRELICPRGKLLGGCSSVNGSVYIRGHQSDYDEWAELGNEGWKFSDVLPVFKRHERHHAGASEYHGGSGELDVVRPRQSNELARAFVEGAVEAGHQRNDDFNGRRQDGFGLYEVNQRNGQRLSSSRAFLHPIWHRKNLHVYTNTTVERIRMRGSRATGVVVLRDGTRIELSAGIEVVLAGGAVNSPHLLMLSGIGPESQLRQHGINVVQPLAGVGENLQDHPTVYVSMANPSGESYALSTRSIPRLALSPFSYAFSRTGPLASNAAEAGGFLRTMSGLEKPDVQMTFLVGLKGNARLIPRQHGFMVLVQLLRPESRGTLALRSRDPHDHPVMRPRFLEEKKDLDTLVRGLVEARKIMRSSALSAYAGEEIEPGAAIESETAITAMVRAQVGTAYHPVGTCKMGPSDDPAAVVDEKLRVYGIEGLRVADASIMPNIVGGNTSAPAMMIGERASDFILETSLQPSCAA